MANYALLQAMNKHDWPIRGFPQRVPSRTLIDKMDIITEGSGSTCHSCDKTRDVEHGYDSQGSEDNTVSGSFTVSNDKMPLVQPKTISRTKTEIGNLVLLSVFAVIAASAQDISTPLYMSSMTTHDAGSDPFVSSVLSSMWTPAIFFLLNIGVSGIPDGDTHICGHPAPWSHLCLVGSLQGLSLVLQALTSLPERTPPYMQSILSHSVIFFTCLLRACILKKGMTRGQIVCIFILFIGIFISLEPITFNLWAEELRFGCRTHGCLENPSRELWYFYFIYGISWFPMALSYVLMEKGNHYQGRHLAYTAWVELFSFLSHFLFICFDFIPKLGLGLAGRYTFWEKIINGVNCFYGIREECDDVPHLALVYVISFSASNVFSIMLIRNMKNAMYTTVVLALVAPSTILFWNFYTAVPELHWDPRFDLPTAFVIAGLCIMTPAVGMYSYFNPYMEILDPQLILEEGNLDNKSALPIRYHQGRPPKKKKPKSWKVKYVDITKLPADVDIRRVKSLSDLQEALKSSGEYTNSLNVTSTVKRSAPGESRRKHRSQSESNLTPKTKKRMKPIPKHKKSSVTARPRGHRHRHVTPLVGI